MTSQRPLTAEEFFFGMCAIPQLSNCKAEERKKIYEESLARATEMIEFLRTRHHEHNPSVEAD
jgi:hypothetical protein